MEKPSPLKVKIQYTADMELRVPQTITNTYWSTLRFQLAKHVYDKIGQDFKEVKVLRMKATRDPPYRVSLVDTNTNV